jgi:branched-chain amino acid transport system permease protein
MDTLAFVLFNGISYGLLLFLLSSGFTLVFGMMGVLNIAHASFFMLGAYLAYEVSRSFGFWAGLLVAPVGVALFGALVERYILRQVRSAGQMAELLVTFGLSYVVTEAVQLVWGRTPVPYPVPAELDFPLFALGGIQYSAYRVFTVVVTAAIFVAVFLMFSLSRLGLVVQAALTHPAMTAALGYNVPRVFNVLFALSAGLAGIGGALAGNVLGTQPTMALQLGALIFVVVVVGGMGSIGVIQTLAVSYPVSLADIAAALGVGAAAVARSGDLRTLSSASIAPLLPYLLMVVVLLSRPRGLFGRRDV